MKPDSILLFVHPPFYRVDGEVFFDIQAQNGLRLWAENFTTVRAMAPLVDVPLANVPSDARALKPFLDTHPAVEVVMLPNRGTLKFISQDYWKWRRTIRDQIAASQYLVFGFAGFLGDWGTACCRIAAGMGRPYGVFKDSVDHRVVRMLQAKEPASPLRRGMQKLQNALMKYRDRQVIRSSALALLHGRDTMEYYQGFASNPHMVHDIHISKSDHISEAELEHRLGTRSGDLLRVAYAGRVEEIKGPDHWVSAIESALNSNANIVATWYGTGTLHEDVTKRVAQKGLEGAISFAGFVPHKQMLNDIRAADVFVHTHMTEESPRCLIEALAAGLPLVGYENAFVRDLVGSSRAGLFVPRGDIRGLARALKELADDPARLAEMARDARNVAAPLNDEDVFRHRCDIIRAVL